MIDGSSYLIAAGFGALIGSFLNVCIHRLPRCESIVWPGSHCPSCGTTIAYYDNIPLFSYLWLMGHCRTCRSSISMRYPVVEAVNAAGYVMILVTFGLTWTTVLPVGLMNALLGVAIGGGILWALAWASPYLFGKEGMGGGDIKLLAMIGAFLGWKPALLTIMVGSLSGSLIGLSLIGLGLMKRDEYIPFGPFLVFGALVSMFFAQPLLEWYQTLLTPSG